MFIKRDKVFTFRLSQEEFAEVKAAAEQQGARCLSEFARNSLLRGIQSRYGKASRAKEMALEKKIVELEECLGKLAESIDKGQAAREC